MPSSRMVDVVVTGGFGFIGSRLVGRLAGSGFRVGVVGLGGGIMPGGVEVLGGDVRDVDALHRVFAEKRPKVVYHLAAHTSHRGSIKHPHRFLSNNVDGTLSVLEAARRVGGVRVVFASSSSVYGLGKPPLREDSGLEPRSPYALSKYIGERVCRMYHDLYGVDCVVLRYFNVVGEGCSRESVFSVFATRILSGLPLRVNGRWVEGVFRPAERDFIYVGDVVEATVRAGELGGFHVINVGTGRPTSVLELAKLMMEEAGRRVPVEYGELGAEEALSSYADITRAKKLLGWEPTTSTREAVRKYIRWLKEANKV